jgi:Tfp pilus assembly protein FimT
MHGRLVSRVGTSMPELVAVLVLTAIILGIAVPRVRLAVERAAVRGAVADIVTTLSTARQLAVSHGGGVSVGIDARAATIRVLRDGDTVTTRPIGTMFGVTLRSSRDSLAYDGRGLGTGAANLTFVVLRGMTADTVVVSRLGRVRW